MKPIKITRSVKWRPRKPWAESGFKVKQHQEMVKGPALMAREKFLVLLSKRIPLETREKALKYYIENSTTKDIWVGSKRRPARTRIKGGRRTEAITLAIAINTLFKEKQLNSGKTLKQIAIEMTAKGYLITSPTLGKINKVLRIFTEEERETITKEAKKRKRDLKKQEKKEE